MVTKLTGAVELIDQLFEVGGSDGEAGNKRDQ